MSTFGKICLLLETVVCFGPVFLLLILGITVYPFAIVSMLFDGDFVNFIGSVPTLFLLAGGIFGMVSLVAMLLRILSPKAKRLSSNKIHLFTLFGVLSIMIYGYPLIQTEPGLHWAVFVLPLLGTIHIYWLTYRNLLKPTSYT